MHCAIERRSPKYQGCYPLRRFNQTSQRGGSFTDLDPMRLAAAPIAAARSESRGSISLLASERTADAASWMNWSGLPSGSPLSDVPVSVPARASHNAGIGNRTSALAISVSR